MALDFPASPIVGATYTGPGGVIWAWDGAKWVNGTQIGTAYAPIDSPVLTGNPTAPNPPAGDADTSVATTAFVAAAVGTALHDVGRNLLHNGLFSIAQRGTGPWTSSVYLTDRWCAAISLDTNSITRQGPLTDAYRVQIGDETATYALGDTFTGNAAAGALTFIWQRIEDVRRLSGKTVTVSFWATTGGTNLNIGVALTQYFGTGGSPSAAVYVNGQAVPITGSFVRKSVTINVPSTAGMTLGTNGDSCTGLELWYSAGSNYAARSGIGVQSGTIWIWGVQLEVGSVATPLEKLDPRMDLANCQRFYQGFAGLGIGGYAEVTNRVIYSSVLFPVTMRAAPTVTYNGVSNANCTGPGGGPSAGGIGLSITALGAGGMTSFFNMVLTADL
jgi:hypothetical protein